MIILKVQQKHKFIRKNWRSRTKARPERIDLQIADLITNNSQNRRMLTGMTLKITKNSQE